MLLGANGEGVPKQADVQYTAHIRVAAPVYSHVSVAFPSQSLLANTVLHAYAVQTMFIFGEEKVSPLCPAPTELRVDSQCNCMPYRSYLARIVAVVAEHQTADARTVPFL